MTVEKIRDYFWKKIKRSTVHEIVNLIAPVIMTILYVTIAFINNKIELANTGTKHSLEEPLAFAKLLVLSFTIVSWFHAFLNSDIATTQRKRSCTKKSNSGQATKPGSNDAKENKM